MTTEDVLRRIVEALSRAGVAYMLTGSFASSYHGSPRATRDIDLVIAPTADQLRSLVHMLAGSEYYVSEDAALDALAREGQFNVVDLATGWKIDLIIRKSRAFSQAEFERRSAVDLSGLQLFMASAEDVLLAKLEWTKAGASARHLEDCADILRARSDELDQAYVEHWVAELGLAGQWAKARKIAGSV